MWQGVVVSGEGGREAQTSLKKPAISHSTSVQLLWFIPALWLLNLPWNLALLLPGLFLCNCLLPGTVAGTRAAVTLCPKEAQFHQSVFIPCCGREVPSCAPAHLQCEIVLSVSVFAETELLK